MGWGSIYHRRMRVFKLAVVTYFDYKVLQRREKWTSKAKVNALWERAHQRNARRVLNTMIELEGLWVKLGQYLSTRADVLPPAYITLLQQLQDSLPPRPVEEVCATIEREMGKPMEDLFSYFDKTPLATASIAQVHRAKLNNGREVVVKVQHEGIKTIILEDLKSAKSIVDWVAWAEPQYNFGPMIDEWCKEAPKELDFNLEAENTRAVYRNLGCNNEQKTNKSANQVDVLIPEVVQSTEKVLILEYMDGIRLNDRQSLEACGVDMQRIVEEITRAYSHQMYVDGLFNGDPHPGNFLVSRERPHRPILLDFGLTKKLSPSMKQALAKMFLASAEGDHVALLSAFAEMGLKMRLDIPEQAMEMISAFFRTSTTENEAHETVKAFNEQRSKNMKMLQEKMNLNKKEAKRFNPVDAIPGDIVIYSRVLNLLRGLSSSTNVRIVYQDIMRPFAESVLQGYIDKGPSFNANWIYDTPIHSDVEGKLRQLLVELGNDGLILGIQICAYKDGQVIIDTAAGVLGKYDPRPVQPDSLFSVFSITKGITAGMMHWLVDQGKLKLDDDVASIWPEFGTNGKDRIKVHHVLNHTSGLHNALSNLRDENAFVMCDWNECLKLIAASVPEIEPGKEQLYHYLSFGYICGGIMEHASGKKFQEILEEAFIRPLNIEGELYVGIPPGVESRLANLTVDTDDLGRAGQMHNRIDLPSSFQPDAVTQMIRTLPAMFNMLNVRRSIIPAANGHCSARALARYYAALVDCGEIPPPHSISSKPRLGSHPHKPTFSSGRPSKKERGGANNVQPGGYTRVSTDISSAISSSFDRSASVNGRQQSNLKKIFSNPRIHEAFLGVEEYKNLALPEGKFGLGFKRERSGDGSTFGFGHSGMGGSTGFCNIEQRFAIVVTLNKMSLGGATKKIINLVCSELNIPLPEEMVLSVEGTSSLEKPVIN